MQSIFGRILFLLIAALMIPACGSSSSGSQAPDFVVSGTAMYEKKGIDSATATLTVDHTMGQIHVEPIAGNNPQPARL